MPIVSAAVGGTLAGAFCVFWSRWAAEIGTPVREAPLLRQNRLALFASHLASLSGLLIGVSLCVFGCYQGHDWGGLALGVGFGCVAPVLILPLCAFAGRRSVRGAFAAYALSMRTPLPALHAMLIAGSAALFWALAATPCG